MKKLIVRLSFLDKVGAIVPSSNLPVLLNNHPDYSIGNCKFFRGANGEPLGELTIKSDIDYGLYFYYMSLNTNDGSFWFAGLNLAEKLYGNDIATTLGEMIIEEKKEDAENFDLFH